MLPVLYKEINLPHPPGDLIDSLIDQWIEQYGYFVRNGTFPNLSLEPSAELLAMDRQRIGTYDIINHEISTWLKDNIFSNTRSYSDWILRMNHLHRRRFYTDPEYYDAKINIYEKHLDSKFADPQVENNSHVLIYNITDSTGDLVYYQEENKPVMRHADRPLFRKRDGSVHQLPHKITEYPNATEIFRCSPPPKTWYLTRIDVIHAVENANIVPRAALQVRLTDKESEKFLSN